ncbi:Pentatricopeptide repeat, partial [Dillenia turbinata]
SYFCCEGGLRETSLVSVYVLRGFFDEAFKLFDDIPDKNVISWTTIIGGFIKIGKFRDAIESFRRFLEMGLKPDSFTLVRILSACTGWGIRRVLGNMEKARAIFDGMAERDIVSWSAMIMGYASNRHPKESLDLYFAMQRENLRPDRYSMVGVLSACASLGALELGEWACGLMNRVEFLANPTLGTALMMYAKCGKMALAWGVFKEMEEKDVVVWSAMISGLAMNGHTNASFALFGQLEKLGFQPDGNTFMGFALYALMLHYGCLVDLLGCAGLLDVANELIKSMPMEANAIVLEALLSGYSSFLVGDEMHPLSGKLYAKLSELAKELELASYVPTTEFVMYDMVEEEKEHFLGVHSEKLALAFGLISTKPTDTIRVVKNLRVCGDCHMAIKLISKITGGEITVRDNNRFHCFLR